MKRAAIIIGVDRTGGMPTLKDAAKGARRVEAWAKAQKFDAIHVFTDENDGSVEANAIKKVIRKIVEAGATHQLLVYFAGHGVNIGYGEYWLLTDAPSDTQAAINLRSSEWQARYCGISHTVFISDACRTAAEGGPAQRVTGSELFPNEGSGELEKPVDVFYASTLGRPALEVRDPQLATSQFSALYTDAFLDGLWGKHSEVLEWANEDDKTVAYVRPRPLKPHLAAELPRRIAKLGLQAKANQVPDAHIVSEGIAWISRLTEADVAAPAPRRATRRGGPKRTTASSPKPPPITAEAESARLLESVLKDGALKAGPRRQTGGRRGSVGGVSKLADVAKRLATPFGPPHHETECGFKIRGAKFAEAYCVGPNTELFADTREVVRMNGVRQPSATVLLVLDNGTGVALPAIPGFLAALTMEDDELIDVAYEPSDNTPRWNRFQRQMDELRALRGVAASATRNGVFRLEGKNALQVAKKMQSLKWGDPTLAVYAAYAYHDLQQGKLIKEMCSYMRSDLGAPLFDVALLARQLRGKTLKPESPPNLIGSFPLLSQGWPLLAAQSVKLPASLKDIQRCLVPSVWTLFSPAGVKNVRNAIQKKHIL